MCGGTAFGCQNSGEDRDDDGDDEGEEEEEEVEEEEEGCSCAFVSSRESQPTSTGTVSRSADRTTISREIEPYGEEYNWV
mgnify:CR=1 FL=1